MRKIEVKNLPFRGGKENIAPDHPKCIECGKCCTDFEGTHLLPEDFIGDDLEKELRQLSSMNLLYIQLRFHGYEVLLDIPNGKCLLLGENGCILTPDMRPAGCRYYRPVTGEKGMKRPNTRTGCISKMSHKKPIWVWRKYGDILMRVHADLDDEHKGICW